MKVSRSSRSKSVGSDYIRRKKDEEARSGQGSYDLALFRQAVVEGRDAAGDPLSNDMPRWKMDDQDLADLADYLQSLP
jgi:mono/diheme cytochrome c family protein